MYADAIRDKRDGKALDKKTILGLVDGIASGDMHDSQVAALAMAICIKGMDAKETSDLTVAFANSGDTIAWDENELGGPVVDKHSTGGVGDKASLLLAPIVASCGAFVPMVSGRGLGHTGGTLDKLEAIPGYKAEQPTDKFKRVVKSAGCAIVGANLQLVPADRRMYSIRDVTATVESFPLITSSILSKKLAAGIKRLVMDVKTGSGAFLDTLESAQKTSKMLVATGKGAGMRVTSLITDMNAPMGKTAGNALEVMETVDILSGRERGDARMMELVYTLAAEMLVESGIEESHGSAKGLAKSKVSSGIAAERLGKMLDGLGANPNVIEDPMGSMKAAPVQLRAAPNKAGWVSEIMVRELGLAVVGLGGGRKRPGDRIDHAVGLAELAALGDKVGPGDSDRPLAIVHAKNDNDAMVAAKRIRDAYMVADEKKPFGPSVLEKVS